MKYISGLILVLFTSVWVSAQSLNITPLQYTGFSEARLQYLEKAMQNYVDTNQISGGVLQITRNGETAMHQAFGWQDKETSTPMQADSLFRIASQTKAITSTGIMILMERGELLLSDPVSKYLPEYAKTTVEEADGNGGYTVVPAKRQITIHDLLTHSSGIGYGRGLSTKEWQEANIYNWYFADRSEPMRDLIARIATLPQEAHPGEGLVYGYSTDILGVIIEVISGQSLNNFLQENILQPLGMTDTHFFVPEDKASRLATVYSATESGLERAPSPAGEGLLKKHIAQGHYVEGPRSAHSGGAGLVSTTDDYSRFLLMLLNNGQHDGKRIISRKSVELMTAPYLRNTGKSWLAGRGFGFGFTIIEDIGAYKSLGSKGSYGWGGAYHSSYWVDPSENLVVVYHTQLLPSGGIDSHAKIRALVYQAIAD